MTIADVYGRKSSADGGKSVADQLTEATELIGEQGWTAGRVFADDNLSASRFARKDRPGFTALVAHIESEACELLVLWESSRGSRNLAEWAGFLDLIRERHVLVYVVSHQRQYDCRISRDWRTLASDGVDACDESNRTSDRALRGKRRSATSGRPAGRLQFGFRRIYDDDSGLFVEQVEHPEQAAIVREAARRVLAGEPPHAIACDFNARGIPGPRGGKWNLGQIKRLCVLPSYAGLRQHQGQVVGKAAWAGIHSPETYSALQARLNDPKRRTQRDSRLKHVLSGVIKCAVCGSLLRVLSPRGYETYTCRDGAHVAIRTTRVEEFVIGLVLTRLERGDAASLFKVASDADEAAAAVALANSLEARLAPFYPLAAAGKLTATGLAAIEADLLPQIAAAREQAVRAAVAPVPAPIKDLLGAPRERWAQLSVAQQRECISLLIGELRVLPTGRGRRTLDPRRLGESRWTDDQRTWGELWDAELVEQQGR